uniref:DUF4258 domain-containing protein n=1 Tax=Candidatus Kentrum eta TaxID=2126337 RepID=A0A450V2A3_9GAMM|nr:MAG: protein of unknown function (DUF4258) [Candidatus Kentron sp. H]VFJ98913.1 MAG: protein of unknown function (DUF4258) [Candidatus Kentron sp. H]VFK03719.1 MAG: protein of unknown function (DUF4258) [Candidatus Kentron sp. H]
MPKLPDLIKGNLRDYDLEYRIHATRRMFERDIRENAVERILREGDVIERYDEDFPLPNVLISGRATGGRSLHLVVGINSPERKFVIITDEPDSLRWTNNFSRRTP